MTRCAGCRRREPIVVVTNDAEIVRDVSADGANVLPSNALLAALFGPIAGCSVGLPQARRPACWRVRRARVRQEYHAK